MSAKVIGPWLVLLCSLVTADASAQVVLNFTDHVPSMKSIEPELLREHPQNPTFAAGNGIYAVLNLANVGNTVGDWAHGTVRVIVDVGNGTDFDPLYMKDYPVSPEQGATSVTVVPVLPDQPDHTFPGYDQLMRMLAAPHRDPKVLFRVRLEGADADSNHSFAVSGFYYDTTAGLGRYAAWNKDEQGKRASANRAYEDAHIIPRTKAVRAYRSVRSDAKIEADARRWWKSHVTGGQVLQGVKTCSDLILVRDQLGVLSEKQSCVLYTYKGGGKCWAQMRRLSYRRLGKDTYDTNLVDSTYATMHVPVGGEELDGAREYEIGCK